jgi:hypothetical protein
MSVCRVALDQPFLDHVEARDWFAAIWSAMDFPNSTIFKVPAIFRKSSLHKGVARYCLTQEPVCRPDDGFPLLPRRLGIATSRYDLRMLAKALALNGDRSGLVSGIIERRVSRVVHLLQIRTALGKAGGDDHAELACFTRVKQ